MVGEQLVSAAMHRGMGAARVRGRRRSEPASVRAHGLRLVVVLLSLTVLGVWPVRRAEPAPVANGVVPSAIVDRYVTVRPPLGTVTVANVSGGSSGQRLLASTLQGVVNRSSARLYLVGMRNANEDQFWLDDYTARGLIDVGASGSLDDALNAYASEATGYVIASDAEPWTINTATSVAAAERALVATPELVAGLQARGLTQIDDHRGKWPDAATAYESIASTYRNQLAYPGLAIQEPGRYQPRDFYVQQGIMTVFTRPSSSDFDRVYDILDTYPTDHPVYGYVADTGGEEVTAVARLAQAGRFLVPTNTADNMSFHIAVAANASRAPVADQNAQGIAPCTSDQANIVLAMTDGDNLTIPEAVYTPGNQWSRNRRGELPLGWSIGPATSVLMPSIWDHYATTATARDEIVGMMGLGYTYTSLMPNGAEYFADSFTLDAALGIDTHWSLDALLTQPDAPGWSLVQAGAAQAGTKPKGILLNYLDFGGPSWHYTADDIPVLNSRQHAYEDGPAQLADQVQAVIDTPADQRPIVTFIAVTVWNSNYDALADAMAPMTAQGVRFLTPSEAVACLPAPPPLPTTTTTTSGAPGSTSAPSTRSSGGSPASVVVATPRFTA